MAFLILGICISGLIVGALGRLVVPGRNPMGLFATIGVGLLGSFLGGLIGREVFGFRYRYAYGLSLVVAVACTALIVYTISRSHRLR